MSHYPLSSLRYLLPARADKARDSRPQFAVSDVILGMVIVLAIAALCVEGAAYLVSAMQIENPGQFQ